MSPEAVTWTARVEGRALRVAPLLAAIVAVGLTRSTMLPGLGFWDTGEFQAVAPVLGTAHPTGYPTFVLLGWLATLVLGSVGEPAVRMNVLSGLLLAGASALTVVAVRQIGGRTLPALAAGVLLALTPIPWLMGSFTDPHTLHLVMVVALLVLLGGWEIRVRGGDERADRWLIAAAAVYGLSLGNHQLTLLLAPGIALFVLASEPRILFRRAHVVRCAGALFGVAALVYLELPIRAAMHAPLVYGHPDTPGGFLYVALGVQFAGDVGGLFAELPRKASDLIGLAIAQFGPMAALLPAAFVAVAARRPRIALLTGTWVAVTCLFAASYDNAMIERYYLGPILCAVIWLGAGASILVDAAITLRSILGWDVSEPVEASASEPGQPTAPETRTGGSDASGAGSDASGAKPGAIDGGPANPPGASAREEAPAAPDGDPAARRRDWFPVRLSFVAAVLLVTPAIWLAPAAFPTVDQSRDTSATAWSTWVFQDAKPDAVILSWWSYSTPLWYRQSVLGVRPDVTIVDDRDLIDEDLGSTDDVIRANLGRRPVYVIRLPDDLADLAARWQLDEVQDPGGVQSLFLVTGPVAGAGANGSDGSAAGGSGGRSGGGGPSGGSGGRSGGGGPSGGSGGGGGGAGGGGAGGGAAAPGGGAAAPGGG